jgi:TRAP-type C4-dicarboxylate transport system permease small subunit
VTEKNQNTNAISQIIDRVPRKLRRILTVLTAIYFVGFLWTFTHGTFQRLFIPFQWKYFFEQREMAAVLADRWFFYGTSLTGLFVNWLVLLGLITAGFYAYSYVQQKKQ